MNIRSILVPAVLALSLGASLASAQSTVAAISGQAQATDTIVIQNVDSGVTKEIKPKANGRYLLRNLPTGTFSVVVKHADGSTEPARVVSLHVGQTVRVQ